ISLTGELNTPSSQQCIVAHRERCVSRAFLQNISGNLPGTARPAPIPELDYFDPFTFLTDRSKSEEARDSHVAALLSKPLEHLAASELLLKIYQADPLMLRKLKDMFLSGPAAEEEE
ncbi:MAG: hypothetical protein HGA26_06790, partial [Chlorobiaceae bacterium]|nr:hypothetical protein [Chlorobiaceae bacterium]